MSRGRRPGVGVTVAGPEKRTEPAVTDAADTPRRELSPAPNDAARRDVLVDLAVKDLLGPVGGPKEILADLPGRTSNAPRNRYLVGVLRARRPERPEGGSDPGTTGGAEEPSDGGDIVEDEELALGGADEPQDGPTDLSVPADRFLWPSSFGFSFCVSPEASDLRVRAEWGQYLREETEPDDEAKTKTVWRRHPRGSEVLIQLNHGPLPPLVPDPDCPEVQVRGRVRHVKRDGSTDHVSVTLFLFNDQTEPERLRDSTWLFQPELSAEAPDGSAVFHRRRSEASQDHLDEVELMERQTLAMLYRKEVEFAVGHGVAAEAVRDPGDATKAVLVRTTVVPERDVPMVTPSSTADADRNPAFAELDGLTLDMKTLAEAAPKSLPGMLRPLTDAYEAWIEREGTKLADPAEQLEGCEDAAKDSLARCRDALGRIRAGTELLDPASDTFDPQAAVAFSFANRAMWQQRVRSVFSAGVRRGENPDEADCDVPANRSWRSFQLAFVLLNLPGLTRLDHSERSTGTGAVADLLFFPTGGGKTEAYLGLTAFTLGLRRLRGVVEDADGVGRDGGSGVTVLMRYILRLLILQQFQRATALICACEEIRRTAADRGDRRWGEEPFRIGLWVGQSATPNRTEDAHEAVRSAHGKSSWMGGHGGRGTPHQLTNCPWCGSAIEPGKHLKVERFRNGRGRTLVFCGDRYGLCPFSSKRSPGEGLPVVVVDEEIYRLLPALLITTVDKFAQMPWRGETEMLFGQVDGRCPRHGFRSPASQSAKEHCAGSHPAKNGHPAVKVAEHAPLRPPDLIVQDELHLISGPLGTLVGLYETAVDRLCTWEVTGPDGGRLAVRPKVVASTATVRRAGDQVRRLFARDLRQFPPNGLDVGDNFFALQRNPSDEHPGRRYIGLCAPGRRLKAALIRAYVALLAAGQTVYEEYGGEADPWMTLVGYFNSLRELGGMRRVVEDEVAGRLRKIDERGLAVRKIYPESTLRELTSRLGSTDIPETLDLLEQPFDPDIFDPQTGKRVSAKARRGEKGSVRPIDVLLATNMISVGVDVPRLGLMVVAGQPKTTAEYIQATSRVGRRKPGVVFTVYNWARPRDLSHYETFGHYHATFYKHVEALSVTPFSEGAVRRGLAALLVSLVRLEGWTFNDNPDAERMATHRHDGEVDRAIDAILERTDAVASDNAVVDRVRESVKELADDWTGRAQRLHGGKKLGYREKKDGETRALITAPDDGPWQLFTCLYSMREVEPTANLVLQDFGMDAPAEEPLVGAAPPTDAGTEAGGQA